MKSIERVENSSLTVLISLLITLFATNQVRGDQTGFPLGSQAFSIRSSISFYDASKALSDSTLSDNGVTHLTEWYSPQQTRARISVQHNEPHARLDSDFIYDQNSEAAIWMTKGRDRCSKGTRSELYDEIFPLETSKLIKLLELADKENDLGYIVGPSKLLLVLTTFIERMKLLGRDENSQPPTRSHAPGDSRPQYEYELRLQLNPLDADDITKLIISSDAPIDSASINSMNIPRQVEINFSRDKITILVHFSGYEPLDDSKWAQTEKGALGDLAHEEKLLDQFAFPASYGCNMFLDTAKSKLFENYSLKTARFSFEAISRPWLSVGLADAHFVALDGPTGSMRIDSYWAITSALDGARGSSQVSDFVLNRKYTIVDSDATLVSAGSMEGTTSRCAVTHLMRPTAWPASKPSLARVLFGAEQFTYMGRARVRGIEAKVYETQSSELPHWFSQPIPFHYPNDTYELKLVGERISQGGGKNSAPSKDGIERMRYNVLLYIVANDDQTMPLSPLLLEVYDAYAFASSSYRRRLITEFHNFLWDLAESADGERSLDLFALKDLCSPVAYSSGERYAELDILLEEELPGPHSEYERPSAEWLREKPRRDQALAASFRDTLELQSTMIYDIESKVIEVPAVDGGKIIRPGRRIVPVTLRLAEHPSFILEIAFLGYGALQSAKHKNTRAVSLAECLASLPAQAPGKPFYVFFYEIGRYCVLDTTGYVQDPSKSKFFTLSATGLGEVFKVESVPDQVVAFKNRWISVSDYRDFQSRVLMLKNLPATKVGQPVEPEPLRLRIKNMKVRNFNYMSKYNGDGEERKQILPPLGVFSGFSLSEQSPSTKRISQPAEVAFNTSTLSKEQCHAACLNSLTCRSYSYCVEATEVRCLISTENFAVVGVREQLESLKVTGRRSGTRLKVDLGSGKSSEVIRNVRCHLHNKLYMELFKRLAPTRGSLLKYDIFKVRDEEQCAERCFEKNFNIIQSSGSMSGQLQRILESSDSASAEGRQRIYDAKKEFQMKSSNFCSWFLYLDSSLEQKQRELLHELAQEDLTRTGPSYCLISESEKAKKEGKRELSWIGNVKFSFDTYSFDFTKLYEKSQGFKLAKSKLSQEEEEAYSKASQTSSLGGEQYELLKRALAEGKNFQLEKDNMPSACAQICFWQTSELWPACRSFDVMVVHNSWGASYWCVLNTGRLTPGQQLTWEHGRQSLRTNFWHFEPKLGQMSQLAEETYSLDASTWESMAYSNSKLGSDSTIGGLFILLLVTVGIIFGLVVGIQVVQRYLRARPGEIDVQACLEEVL